MKRSVLAGILIGLGCTCLFFVWLKLDLVRVGYTIERLEKKKAEVLREYESLELKWSQLTSPQKIAQGAEKLGLRSPRPGQVVMVTVESVDPMQYSGPASQIQLAQTSVQAP